MPPQRTLVLVRQPGATIRGGIAAAGTLVALAGLAASSTSTLCLALLPALFMVLAMCVGVLFTAAGALLLAVACWLLSGSDIALHAGIASLIGAGCGELLRRGVAPLYLVAPLLLGALAGELFSAGVTRLQWPVLARALFEGSAAVALATVVFLLRPRRSPFLPARSRARLDHIAFAASTGVVSVAGVLVLAGQPQAVETTQAGAGLATPLAVAVLFSLVAGFVIAKLGQRALRRAGADRVRAARLRLPLEMQRAALRSTRERRLLERRAARDGAELQQLRQVAQGQADELRRTRDALRQRSAELQNAVAAGATTRARHDALMDGIPAAALFTDAGGRIQAANRLALSLLGHQPDELRGEGIGVLVPDEHILDHPLGTGETGQLKATRRIESCRVRRQDGSVRELAVQVLAFESGGKPQFLVLLREADNTRRALAALEAARATARSMHQSRDMFIATMSHEMRTPLHGLIATLDMLRSNESMGDVHNQLSIARTSARALLKIANDVLDFTRIGSSQFTLDRRAFGMRRILREVVEEAHAHATSLGLALTLEVEDQVPQAFVGDASRLKQILGNLVSNALKFTREGGVRLDVSWDGRQCFIDVCDSGEGIPEEKRERIFEPFVQAHVNSRAQVGTGLGLPISRRLAEAMGGELALLQSGPRGSVFRLTLRLDTSDELPDEEQSLRVFRNPRGRILVVEDNPANRYVAQALLNGLECPATIVEGGAQALELLREQDFDLILMDCQMPGMDGYEATRQARRILKKHIPIIAMTANAMANDRKVCLDAGMDDFLPKPFDRRALNDLLCKWLDPSRAATGTADTGRQLAQLPDLDEGVLNELYESLQWQIAPLNQIRHTFNESLKPMGPLLRSAGPAQRSALQRQLHTLLGSSGMVGARQVEFLAGQMRQALGEQRYPSLAAMADELERAMQRYNREFENWLQKEDGGARRRPRGLRLVNEGKH